LAFGPFSGNGVSNSIAYQAWGAVNQLENGCVGSTCTQLMETYHPNKRLQTDMVELGTTGSPYSKACKVYNFYSNSNPGSCAAPSGTTGNNGNVTGYYFSDGIGSCGQSATNGYDGVNRLSGAAATGNCTYSQTSSYDAYGNMSCSPSSAGCTTLSFNASTNRISTSGYAYDAAGNLTGDGTNTYQWDAEGRLTKAINGYSVTFSTNTYNALGQRVRDQGDGVYNTVTTDEAYGAEGSLLWRYTGDSNWRQFVPFNGRILAEYYSSGTLFDHPDELGSITAASDQNGTAFQERLFYPFGELLSGYSNLGMHQTFAQLPDYDPEIDQYNTLNRHYPAKIGRWLSPDSVRGDVNNPQSLNLYPYVLNNPATSTDPTGKCGCGGGWGGGFGFASGGWSGGWGGGGCGGYGGYGGGGIPIIHVPSIPTLGVPGISTPGGSFPSPFTLASTQAPSPWYKIIVSLPFPPWPPDRKSVV
jgi:RHS repeat-associated protein